VLHQVGYVHVHSALPWRVHPFVVDTLVVLQVQLASVPLTGAVPWSMNSLSFASWYVILLSFVRR